jgi:hypothetical protein
VADAQAQVRRDVEKVRAVADTLDPANGALTKRRRGFEELRRRFSRQKNVAARQMAKLMTSFTGDTDTRE